MIGVADRERLGQRIVERDVLALEIAHRIGAVRPVGRAVRRQPLVHSTVVPRLMLDRPFMAGRGQLLRVGQEGVEMRSEEHTSELQSLMRISYAVFCLKKKTTKHISRTYHTRQISVA